MALEIVRVPVLQDNYIWLIHDPDSGDTVVVDPAVTGPVLAAADERGWAITQIWNTHWHPDHTGGNEEIKQVTGCLITGPAAEADRIPTLDRQVKEGDSAWIGNVEAKVIEVPAHTSGHIAYYLPSEGVAFVGDTLFAMGCGRLFEGTAEQMFANMRKLENLPPETLIYCAHEYTLSNAKFAVHADPDNTDISARYEKVAAMRESGEATVPTTIAEERATNVFMRAGTVEELARLRAEKDAF